MSDRVVVGNAAADAESFRGWFVGHFVPAEFGLRSGDRSFIDACLWAPGVAHRWEIEEDDTVVLTVRWPSRTGIVDK